MNVRIMRRALGAVLALSLAASMPARAGSVSVHLAGQARYPSTYEEGLAVLGSRFLYVGTSSGNQMYVYNLKTGKGAAHWTVPLVQGAQGYAYGMEHLALAPDNRTLYFGNLIRGDVVAVDVTHSRPLRELFLKNRIVLGLAVSADSRLLYVQGGRGTDIYDAASGNLLNSIPSAYRVAVAANGTLYGLSFSKGFSEVRAYDAQGRGGRMIADFMGDPLAQQDGGIALSPDGRRLYLLWNGLRAVDIHSGRLLSFLPLPLAPAYSILAVAPNGQQALLLAPNIAGWTETPTDNPNYVYQHFGFVAGGVVAVNLSTLRPIAASLPRISTPKAVAYTADSRYALVTESHAIDEISTGIAGADHTPLSPVSLLQPYAAGNNGPNNNATAVVQDTPAPQATPVPQDTPVPPCGAWNIAGTWTFTASATAVGAQSGTAMLQQSGTSVSGTLSQSVGSDTLTGSMQGSTLTLTVSQRGLVDQTFTGAISADGGTIAGDMGTFSGHATCQS